MKERRRVLEELWSFSLFVVEVGVEGVEDEAASEFALASDVSSVSIESRAPLIRRRNSSATPAPNPTPTLSLGFSFPPSLPAPPFAAVITCLTTSILTASLFGMNLQPVCLSSSLARERGERKPSPDGVPAFLRWGEFIELLNEKVCFLEGVEGVEGVDGLDLAAEVDDAPRTLSTSPYSLSRFLRELIVPLLGVRGRTEAARLGEDKSC